MPFMECRVSIEDANKRTVRYIVLPVLLLAAAVFILNFSRWDFSFWTQSSSIGFWRWMLSYVMWMLIFIATLLAGVFVHEGIHGVLIALFAKGGFRSLSFGFDRKTMSPFAQSRVPLRAWQMSTVCLGPLVLQGIVPMALAVWWGSVFVFVLSVIFVIAAGGDIIYAGLLRKVPSGAFVEDLPDAVGYRTVQ